MGDQIGAVDRISELPDFISHHIMSYLSTKEAAQTCLLSKRWNHLRTSFPIFDFDQIYFVGEYLATQELEYFSRREKIRFRRQINKFIRFADASLLRFCELKVSMQKFRLSMTLLDVEEDTSFLDKWIELAVANEVKEFYFNFKMSRDKIYSLPGTILSAKFVTTLKLSGCNMELSSKTIRLHSLRKLSLDKVRIDEQLVQKFISECPLLEDLFLSPSWHSKRFCISHAPKLKILTIDASSNFCYVQNIEIVAPSLQQCTIIFFKAACVIDMAVCSDLKYLNLTNVYILDQDFHNLISKFPLLEKLIVCKCPFLERLSLSSNRLKELQVFWSSVRVIDIDAPSLLTFSYDCHGNPAPSINVLHPCSWKVSFLFDGQSDTLIWFDSIKKFLEVPFEIEELSISMLAMDSFTLDEFRKRLPLLPREVGNLTIDAVAAPPSNYAALLDCFLWICYPRTLSIKTHQSTKFIKWLYRRMIKREAKCCSCYEIKCWQHYLKDFKIESFIPFKNPKPLHIDDLMVMLPELLPGTIRFRLDWCFSEHIELPMRIIN